MKKFQFRLKSVEDLKELKEKEALKALGKAQQAYQLEIDRLNQMRNVLNESFSRRESLGSESTRVVAFQIEQDFINGTKQRIIQCENAVIRAARGVEKARAFYMNARRQKMTFENLRKKLAEKHKKQEKKKEDRKQDDLYLMRDSFQRRDR